MASTQTLTIPSGGTDSEVFGMGTYGNRQTIEMAIIAPATLPETVTVQVAGALGNYADLRTGGTDITLAARKCDFITVISCENLRLHAGSATGGDRVFEIMWQVKPYSRLGA